MYPSTVCNRVAANERRTVTLLHTRECPLCSPRMETEAIFQLVSKNEAIGSPVLWRGLLESTIELHNKDHNARDKHRWVSGPTKRKNSTSCAFWILKLKVIRSGKLSDYSNVFTTDRQSAHSSNYYFVKAPLLHKLSIRSQSNYWPITSAVGSGARRRKTIMCSWDVQAELLQTLDISSIENKTAENTEISGPEPWAEKQKPTDDPWITVCVKRITITPPFVGKKKKNDWLIGWGFVEVEGASVLAVAGCCCSRRAANGPVK